MRKQMEAKRCANAPSREPTRSRDGLEGWLHCPWGHAVSPPGAGVLPRRQVLPGGLQLHVGSSLPKAKSKIVPAQPERDMTQGTVLDPSLGTGQPTYSQMCDVAGF